MKINVITAFPEAFNSFLSVSMVKRAIDKGILDVRMYNLRDYSTDRHRTIDDYSYGGGEGMVIKLPVVVSALRDVQEKGKIILLSPKGRRLNQSVVAELSHCDVITLICGHYEGVDERVKLFFDVDELSIGDYVLTGGELAAMVVIDSVMRLIPGALGRDTASKEDSFSSGLLEYPHYTRPEEFEGIRVPEVLLSGDHKRIDDWRLKESISITAQRRPELFQYISPTSVRKKGIHLLLVHYPVLDRRGNVVSTAIANLDVHDIARSCKTFGIKHFWIVTPLGSQRELVAKIIAHWTSGYGADYNPMRKDALNVVKIAPSLEDAMRKIASLEKCDVISVSTTAKQVEGAVSFSFIRQKLFIDYERAFAIIVGTGWGLDRSVIDSTTYVLEPIRGAGEYNHLSVRSAAAIILDRLLGIRRD